MKNPRRKTTLTTVQSKKKDVWKPKNKIGVKSKCTNRIGKVWREFCTATAIVGLRFIGGHRPAQGLTRILWIILWISQFCLCVWLSTALFLRYIQYDIATAMSYDVVNQLPFPAITICNMNFFRKSIIGGNMPMMIALAAFYAKEEKHISQLIDENNRTCFLANKSKTSTQYLDMSFIPLVDMAARDTDTDVIKCWWNDVEIDCSGLFVNHITDFGWCYTFNQDKSESENVETSDNSGINFGGYGMNKTKWFEKITQIAGVRNGLRLVLDVGQQDYCGAGRKYSGAGFLIQVHDPRTQANFLTTSAISLKPGFDYSIELRPVLFKRNTEHLGLCLSKMYLKMFPQFECSYFQMACWAQCVTELMLTVCTCVTNNYEGMEKSLSKIFNLPLSKVKVCSSLPELFCMRRLVEDSFTKKINTVCPSCKVSCMETFYDQQISSSRYPKDRWFRLLGDRASLGNRSSTEFNRNFLKVDFFFNTMTLLTVAENQAFTMKDLVVAFGFMMGLFLGTSFMTPFEILYYLTLSLDIFVKRLPTRRRNDRIQTIGKNVNLYN